MSFSQQFKDAYPSLINVTCCPCIASSISIEKDAVVAGPAFIKYAEQILFVSSYDRRLVLRG